MTQNSKNPRSPEACWYDIRGLEIVPVGLWFLVSAAGVVGWWPWFEMGRPISHILGLGLALALSRLIGAYYKRTFSQIQRVPSIHPGAWLAAFSAIMLVAIVVDWSMKLPVSLVALTTAAFCVYLSMRGEFRKRYALIAVLFVGLSLLPLLLEVPLSDPVYGSGGVLFKLVVGLSLIIGGIFDHLLLVRSPKPMSQDSHGRGVRQE